MDARDITRATFGGMTLNVSRVIVPADGAVRYNATYDVTFTNISTTSGPTGPGYGPASQTTGMRLVTPLGFVMPNPRDAVPDGARPGAWNVAFPSQALNVTGFWLLEDGAGVDVATFLVQPEETLSVTFSQSFFQYEERNVTFVITVSPLASGQSANLDGPGIPANTQVFGPGGQYVYAGPLPEAGSLVVHANRSLDGDAFPEVTGRGTLAVSPSFLSMTLVDGSAKVGFQQPVRFNVTYPNGTPVFCPTWHNNCSGGNPLLLVNYNLSVNTSFGTLYSNASTVNTLGTPASLCLWTSTSGCASSPPGVPGWSPVWQFDASGSELGVFSFRPNGTWPAGTYHFDLRANVKGSGGSLHEFQTAWTFTPAMGGPVNLAVSGNATGQPVQPLSNLSVVPPATGLGPAGAYTLHVDVSGESSNEHPTTTSATPGRAVIDGFGPGNVTITGDVLDHDTLTSGFSYDPQTGRVTLQGITPRSVHSDVRVDIAWKGATTTATLPVTRGATLGPGLAVLPVGETSTVTFTARDDFGNPATGAQVSLWRKPSGDASGCADLCGATVVNGTGAPGAGQNGQYAFTFTPGSAGTYVVHARVGSGPGAKDAYALLRTVDPPACDWADTVCPFLVDLTATTATRADGASFGVDLNATGGYDAGLDAVEPPAPADPDHVQAYFASPGDEGDAARLHRSLHAPAASHAWPLVVRTGVPNESVTLAWSPPDAAGIDPSYDVELVDGSTVVDMRAASTHAFATGPAGERALLVRVRQTADASLTANATLVPARVTLGASLTVRGTAFNGGALPAANATATLHLDGVLRATIALGTIPARGSVPFAFPPVNATDAGEHAARVEVHTATVERTTLNNSVEKPYYVAKYLVDLQAAVTAARGLTGTNVTYHADLTNLGNVEDTFDLEVYGVPAGWTARPSAWNVTLAPNETAAVTLTVGVPADALNPTVTAGIRLAAWSTSAYAFDTLPTSTTMLATHRVSLAEGWSLVSLPVTPDDADVADLLPDAEVAYQWDGQAYAEATTLAPGRGYWVLSLAAGDVDVVGVPLRNASVALAPGWNLVGAALLPTDLAHAPANVSRTAWGWGASGYVETGTLAAGNGYWLHSDGPAAPLRMGASLALPRLPAPRAADGAAFVVPLAVAAPGGVADAAAFGMAPGATRGYDRQHDALEAPRSAAGASVQAWLREAEARNGGRLHRSIVEPSDGATWTLRVETDAPEAGLVQLTWTRDAVAQVPAGYRVHLVDGLTRIDMRTAEAYAFPVAHGETARDLAIVVQRDSGACLAELDGACLLGTPVDPFTLLP